MNEAPKRKKENEEFRVKHSWRLESEESFASPNEQYIIKIENYVSNTENLHSNYSSFKITSQLENVESLEFFTDDRFFHAWIEKSGTMYLIYAEFLGGQSIIRLSDNKSSSFFREDDAFIWTDFFISPNARKIAIIGCYWACPYEIVVYDFDFPMNLPLPIIYREMLQGNNEQFGQWLNEGSFSMISDSGTQRVVSLSSHSIN
jgi:hypothetical protein